MGQLPLAPPMPLTLPDGAGERSPLNDGTAAPQGPGESRGHMSGSDGDRADGVVDAIDHVDRRFRHRHNQRPLILRDATALLPFPDRPLRDRVSRVLASLRDGRGTAGPLDEITNAFHAQPKYGQKVQLARTKFRVRLCSNGDIVRPMDHWAERVEHILDQRGMTVRDLAERSGVPYDTLVKAIRRRANAPREGLLSRVATALGTTEVALRYGRSSDVEKIPLLDMNKLGTIASRGHLRSAWDGVSMVSVSGDFSSEAFGIVLIDDSCAPEFQEGDIIICDPSEPPLPGKFVVASIDGIPHGIVRRFRQIDPMDVNSCTLVPTNADFPEIRIGCPGCPRGVILGRAVAHQRKL